MAYVLNSTGRSRRRSWRAREDANGSWHDESVYASSSRDRDCRCKAPECQQARPTRNVIYGGPCPPDPELDCQPPLPPPPCDPIWYQRESTDKAGFANYVQMGALSVDAGETIPLDTVVREACGSFNLRRDRVNICQYGTYLALFTLTIPAESSVDTQISMLLDGELIPGSTINVMKAEGMPGSAFVQAVFDVTDPPSNFEVVSSNAMDLIGDAPLDTLASLTLVQLDGAFNDRPNKTDNECQVKPGRHRCNCAH